MRKSKKVFALLLTVSMAVGLFAGCGEQTEKTGGDVTSEVKDVKEENKDSASSEEKEVFTLTVHAGAEQGDWNEYWLIKTIEEKFNVDIQVEMMSSDVLNEKIPLMFASGELPDFFVNSIGDVSEYGSEGFLLNLADYVSEEATPNIWAMWEEYPAAKAANTELDGNIYAITGINSAPSGPVINHFYINYDWAEELLGKVPETLDEFYEYLVGVKENDMNGNGDATDEIPLGGFYGAGEATSVFSAILGAFGYTRLGMEAIDGEVVYVPAVENYQYFLEFMHKLYAEELLDPEFFTQTGEQVNAKETNYLYGCYSYYASWVNQPEETIWRQYDLLEPLTSEYNSERKVAANDISTLGKFMITKNCENPEKLMEILDWMLSEEGYWAICCGPEKGAWEEYPEYGYTYEFVNDYTITLECTFDESEYANVNEWRQSEITPPYGYLPEVYAYENLGAETQNYLIEQTIEHYGPYWHVGWPSSIKYTAEENEELALLNTDINSYKDEMITKMITGEVSTDEFESYVQGLKDRGLERMLEIQQTAYDRWVENQ